MDENPGFEVTVEQLREDAAVVSVVGDLDLMGATKLHRPLMDALSRPLVVLDLGRCEFCDSSGLRTLLQAIRRAEAQNGVLRLAGVGTAIVRVLEVTGLLTELTLYPDVETALKD